MINLMHLWPNMLSRLCRASSNQNTFVYKQHGVWRSLMASLCLLLLPLLFKPLHASFSPGDLAVIEGFDIVHLLVSGRVCFLPQPRVFHGEGGWSG
jgi:hypothetical protein